MVAVGFFPFNAYLITLAPSFGLITTPGCGNSWDLNISGSLEIKIAVRCWDSETWRIWSLNVNTSYLSCSHMTIPEKESGNMLQPMIVNPFPSVKVPVNHRSIKPDATVKDHGKSLFTREKSGPRFPAEHETRTPFSMAPKVAIAIGSSYRGIRS